MTSQRITRAKRRRATRAFRPKLEMLEYRFAPAVLSDNLAAVSGGVEAASGDRWLTSSFGTDANVYNLTDVTLLLSNPVSGAATVAIYTDGGLQPGSLVGTLTPPATYSTTLAETTFTATGISLDANSTYWVVLSASSGEFDWSWTADNTGSGVGFQHTFGDSTDAGGIWFTYDIFPTQMSVTAALPSSAGITVSPTSGLTTTEAGGTASFTVVLDSQPTADVTIGISSNDTSEGTVSASSLTFTSANWDTAQTVTVTGVDDMVDDGSVGYSIVTAAAVSADSNYSGLNASDVSVSNTDNDTAGITVNPTSGLTTTEAGGAANFTVVLNTEPTADVTIAISSNDTSEGSVAASSLTFTTANWNVTQSVTVTGVDDFVADGDIGYSVVTGAATSSDSVYSGLNAADVSVTNSDDDPAGITVSLTSGLVTTEAGGAASFTVALNSQPTADVTIAITSNDTTEGAVSTSSLVFTAANWNSAQTVTVTGSDDFVDDSDIAYSIVTGTAASSDSNYNGLNPSDVSVTNTDDDAVGVTVSPASGLVTTESGGTASFTVELNSQPGASVTIEISSNDTTEGTVSANSLTFTAANWNVAQSVTITGVDDFVDDGDIGFAIVTLDAVSSDAAYNGVDPADVSVTNSDNDTAGITVSPTSGLLTTEAGGAASFTVVLNSQPTANVTIAISSSDTTEGTVPASSLIFTTANWNVAQTVTVTGVDDVLDDGDIGYLIVTGAAASADSGYNGLDAANVSVTNSDNDTTGIIAAPTSGLVTSEAGGAASFTVVLGTPPAADVSVPVASSDLSEGTVSTSLLTFSPANWNVGQTVTITGADDLVADGDINYAIGIGPSISSDSSYNGLSGSDVSVTNTDNDAAGITVSPIAALATTEAGGTTTFTVVLNSQPTADVTIAIASNDSSEGTTSVGSLTFTDANWNIVQTVTVTGVDDFVDDGDIGYSIVTGAAASSDAGYSGLNASDVSVTNSDDDTAGITVSPISGLVTTEAGGAASFTVVLNSQPTADVTIAISSSDTTEGTASPNSLTFTSANWNVAQIVTATGVNDLVDDGDIGYSIATGAAASADSSYDGMNASDVSVTNTDNDTAGIMVNPISGLDTTEAGGMTSFTVVLNSQPTGIVTIPISSSDTTEGTVNLSSLTFTTANWNVARTVTVTGVNDLVDDGDEVYSVVTGAAVSADAGYAGLNAADAQVTNTDDDTAGIAISPISGLVTTEAGGAASFTVVLGSQPVADVTIAITSSDTTEGTVSSNSLTFTSADWNVAQTVTVTGVVDLLDDGDIGYTIVTGAAVSSDSNYSGLIADDVLVTNLNDDATATVVSDIRLAGPKKSVRTVVLTFSQILDAATAVVDGNYEIRAAGHDGLLGTADDTVVDLADPTYDAATQSVTLTANTPFKRNKFVRLFVDDAVTDNAGNPLDGDRDGTAGGDLVAFVGLGTKFVYSDSNGDSVSLSAKKATMEIVRDADGEGRSLTLSGVRTGASLTGSVRQAAGGDGVTHFETVRGTTGVNLTGFRQPPFIVANPIAARVVDRLLDSNESALDLLADAIAGASVR